MLSDGVGSVEVIVVVRRWRVRSGRLRFDAFDLFDFVFRQDVVEPAAAIPHALRRLPGVVDSHVRTVSELQPHFFVEVPAALAAEKGIRSGDMVRVRSARGSVEGKAMVTKRMRGLTVAGKTVYQVGLPIHWGFIGRVTGPLINNLSPSVVDPNAGTPEYKGFLVNLEKI